MIIIFLVDGRWSATSTKIYRRVCVWCVCGTQVYTHDMYGRKYVCTTFFTVQVHNLYHGIFICFYKIKQVGYSIPKLPGYH